MIGISRIVGAVVSSAFPAANAISLRPPQIPGFVRLGNDWNVQKREEKSGMFTRVQVCTEKFGGKDSTQFGEVIKVDAGRAISGMQYVNVTVRLDDVKKMKKVIKQVEPATENYESYEWDSATARASAEQILKVESKFLRPEQVARCSSGCASTCMVM